MPFQQVDAVPVGGFSDPESIYLHLKAELPGYADTYYRDMQERVITLAMERGQNIATVVESFIVGARLRQDCSTCLGSGFMADVTEKGTF